MPHENQYFDLQVNGYAGFDFNEDDLTAEQLNLSCQALRKDGTVGILATIITDDLDRMCSRLHRVVELRQADPVARQMIAGLHIEGPFINPRDGYRGAHPLEGVRVADVDAAQRLLDAGGGLVRLLTLAPECDKGLRVTKMLADKGVVVSAGHCDPTLDQLKAAIDAGLGMFTHLGNGCPMQIHRHDNIIQRALSLSDRLWCCFIADGVHVPIPALRNYLRAAGLERSVVVTDAVAPAGKGPGRYKLGKWDLVIGEDLVAMAPDRSHLLGSAINFPRSVKNLIDRVGLTPQQAELLTVVNPRKAIGLPA